LNQKVFHLPDGREQCAHDDAVHAPMVVELDSRQNPDANSDKRADPRDQTKSRFQFDDVERYCSGQVEGKERIER
jgi:hypothetical protein